MKTLTLSVVVFLAVHLGSAQQQYHTWSRTWTSGPNMGGGGKIILSGVILLELLNQMINHFIFLPKIM